MRADVRRRHPTSSWRQTIAFSRRPSGPPPSCACCSAARRSAPAARRSSCAWDSLDGPARGSGVERQPPTILSEVRPSFSLPHAASARGGLRPISSTELLGRRGDSSLWFGSGDATLRVTATPLLPAVQNLRLHTDERLQSAGSADLLLALAGEPRDVLHPPRAARRARGILWTAPRAEAAWRDSLPRS